MRIGKNGPLWSGLLAAGVVGVTHAQPRWDRPEHAWAPPGGDFRRIATLPNYVNNADPAAETVAEILAATKDGQTLVYTDSPGRAIGFVDITNPREPISAGKIDVGGEPTSVAVLGNRLALVAVNTSASFVEPSGQLQVWDVGTRALLATHELGGQPDSIALSPDDRYAAIVIENERDEDVEVGGVEGGLPQLPSGELVIVDIAVGNPASWALRQADLTGLSAYAPEDAEPEFVDINDNNEAVVTLQENNHIAIVDLRTGKVIADFPAGTVELEDVDATEDGLISLTESLAAVPREPDAVAWIPAGFGPPHSRFGRGALIATANEGDLFGGSRGFSIFDRDGRVLFDSGNALERLAVRHGHYPESRSENKGTEPESIEYGRFGKDDYLFVGSERGSFIAVYELLGGRAPPKFKQLLPAPFGPEGLLAIPERGLLIASGENDDPTFGVRSTIMIYALGNHATYPQILSANDDEGNPIAWSALSGMTAVPRRPDRLLAVWDSYFSEGKIFEIDASKQPAVIIDAITVRGGSGDFDFEGIAIAPDGTYWIASEGNADDSRPNRLLQTDTLGNVIEEIRLPAEIEACRAASTNRGSLGSGFEGVAVLPQKRGYVLAVAQQRGWDYTTPECEALDDDPAGANSGEPAFTRIWLYDPKADEWDHVAYELEPRPANATWVGLSEITLVGGTMIVLERDNRTGDFGELKTLVKFPLSAGLDRVVSRTDKRSFDLIPALEATNGWMTDKPEGVAVTAKGQVYVVTDNDGVEDWSGETWFLRLGSLKSLFPR